MEGLAGTNILVTGGSGLVGAHLVELLLEFGCHVIVPLRSSNPFSYFETQRLPERVVRVYSDIRDSERVKEMLIQYEVSYVIHLAAQAIVTSAFYNPESTIATNVMGTTSVLEAVRRAPFVRGVIVASSDKAYGKSGRSYRESDPLRGDHPYEASKSAADLISRAYFRTYGLPVVVTRFGNIYGPGDLHFNRIIPGMMKTIITGEPLVLRSDGTYTRDYIYVKDVASAYIFLLQRIDKLKGEAFNISCDSSFTVLELLKLVETVVGRKIPFSIAKNAVNEIPYQHLNYRKIRALGWQAVTDFPSAIGETFAWYKRFAYGLF